MTSRERGQTPRQANSVGNHGPQSIDLAEFVARYNNLLELLFPLRLAGNAFLYIFRWQNYLLTLVVLIIFSALLYHPSFFLSFLTIMAILLMGVGKYYSQTKALSQLKKRVRPNVELLDQDAQHFRRLQKEQKKSHKTLVDFKQIIHNVDNLIITATTVLEYFYNIILWKSPEVSVCVTILLCLGFVLLCTVYLKAIIVCIPLIVLCFNGYFLRRTVDCIKKGVRLIISVFRWRHRSRAASGNPAAASSTAAAPQPNTEPQGSAESTDGANRPSRSTSSDSSANAAGASGNTGETPSADSNAVSDSDDPGRSRTESTRSTAASASGAFSGDRVLPSGSKAVGFCSNCNVSFAKLLKRKHDCMGCGHSFCGSCTVKVKRALLGATSPAAFEESVRVCLDCNAKLNAQP